MEKIVSKRHPLRFYGVLLFLLCLVFALTLILISEGALLKGKQGKLLVPFGVFLIILYTIIRYWINTPVIIVTHRSISFNKRTYSFEDIERIEFTGKQRFKYLLGFSMEGAMIVFKNMQIEYIFDDLYKNTPELKMFLDHRINNKILPTIKNIHEDVSGEHFYYYKGNFFLSMRGLFFMGFVILFFYLITKLLTVYAYIPVIIVSLLCFGVLFLFSTHLNYFGLNKDYFIVKNYIFFWKTTVYHISDIKEIIYESQGKMPNCLRIITNDYKNKLYPAGTVRTSEWLEMKSIFEKENIIVRNECI